MAVDDELGLGPALHNLWRRVCELLRRSGASHAERPLDPMVVDHEAWRAMRRGARTWPDYKEAPNRFSVRVSQPDWDEYWGIDPERKAESVTGYLLRQAAERGLWVAGVPKVTFSASEEVARGSVSVSASFAESAGDGTGDAAADEVVLKPASDYLQDSRGSSSDRSERLDASAASREVEPGARVPADETVVVKRTRSLGEQDRWEMPSRRGHASLRGYARERQQAERVPEDVRRQLTGANPDETIVLDRPNVSLDDTRAVPRPVRPGGASKPAEQVAYLLGDGGFRMLVHPGDVIGAVQGELEMPEEVNVRLDGRGFPGVEPKQLALNLDEDGWTLTDYPESGTTVDRVAGGTETVRAGETCRLNDGDVIYLGPTRPMRFHVGE